MNIKYFYSAIAEKLPAFLPTRKNQHQCLDPFQRINEVFLNRNILQHLSTNDLLKASEVSPLWWKIINEDKKFREKIVLTVKLQDESFFNMELLRTYKKVRIVPKIPASCSYFIDSSRKQPTLKRVNIDKCLIVDFVAEEPEKAESFVSSIIRSFWNQKQSMEKQSRNSEEIYEMIGSLGNLEVVTLEVSTIRQLCTFASFLKVSLRPKQLKFINAVNFYEYHDIYNLFERFLEDQRENLKEVEFVGLVNHAIVSRILKTTKVEIFSVDLIMDVENMELVENKFITTLSVRNNGDAIILIKVLPNLKKLCVQQMTSELAEFLTRERPEVVKMIGSF